MHFEAFHNQVWHLHSFVCFAALKTYIFARFWEHFENSLSDFSFFSKFENLDFWRKFGAFIFELGPLFLYGAGAGGVFPEGPVVLPSLVLHVNCFYSSLGRF